MKSKIQVKVEDEFKEVEINKELSQEIEENVVDKWQEILDLATKMFDVPNALIMRLHEEDLEVFAKSSNEENMFTKNKHTSIGVGHYCETVLGKNEMLLVKDALTDPQWQDNPDLKYGLSHYLGFPLQWPDGEMFGTMCILDYHAKDYSDQQLDLFNALKGTIEKDLTLVDRNVQLSKSMEKLEKSQDLLISHEKNHLTNELVSSITHEISTPLGVALTTASYIDYIAKKENLHDTESILKLQEGAGLLQRNIEQATSMIKSFKKISSDQGRQLVELIDFELYVKSIVASLKYELRKKDVQVDFDLLENNYIRVNSGALTQVVINLVMNASIHAFKNSSNNIISISSKNFEDYIELNIADNGIGMAEEETNKMFEPFVRFDDHIDGTGLGLTIVKDIVENSLNGHLSYSSKLNEGTTFTIKLPIIHGD